MSSISSPSTYKDSQSRIVLIGAGTIGLSFAALHLQFLASPTQLAIYDTRPSLHDYIATELPKFLDPSQQHLAVDITLPNDASPDSLAQLLSTATIVQEQGPENVAFKTATWKLIEQHAPPTALFWSSTSGIPASAQARDMRDPSRLHVVHPFNPPHIMPLLELVPSPDTKSEHIDATLAFWHARGRKPVVIKKETTGFVANRLAYALLREAVHMVDQGVVSVAEIDQIVTESMGPRWAVAGPFKSYHAGGGAGGLEGFFGNIGGTVQRCWDDAGRPRVGEGKWEEKIFREAEEAYGRIDVKERDRLNRAVLAAARSKEGEQ